MGGSCLALTAAYMGISLIGLSWRINLVINEVVSEDSVAGNVGSDAGRAAYLLELLLDSYITVALLVNLMISVLITGTLCLKTLFFGRLYPVETSKSMEILINYIVQKGSFIPLVIHLDHFQAFCWTAWFFVICSLKLFEVLAKERLERLNSSPSTTPWIFFRVYLALLFVLFADIYWEVYFAKELLSEMDFLGIENILDQLFHCSKQLDHNEIRLCVMMYRASESSSLMLLLFEPLGIAFETTQAIMLHGLQLIDTYNRYAVDLSEDCQGNGLFNGSGSGSMCEWKSMLIRDFGFLMEMMTLLMATCHYVYIWWLDGLSLHVIDVILLLNLRTLLATLLRRVKGFIKLRSALSTLQAALPDASTDELLAYNDECAICKEPMASAKKLSCNHLFHLSCLRAWLDQGMSEAYSCPTCRRPLVMGAGQETMNPQASQVAEDEELAREMSSRINQSESGHDFMGGGTIPNQQRVPGNSLWRTSPNRGRVNSFPNVGLDGAGPSSPGMRSVGLGRVQMMMRHLAALGGTYSHDTLDDDWTLWPVEQAQAESSGSLPPPSAAGQRIGLRFRNSSPSATENVSSLLSMANTVREVLPHIPDEIIFQDLRRTSSVALTIENLLHL